MRCTQFGQDCQLALLSSLARFHAHRALLARTKKGERIGLIDTPLSSQAAETLRMRPVSRPPTACQQT